MSSAGGGGDGSAPSWLFSFVDLAFLSMIAMTQLTNDVSEVAPNLGEMIVPKIERQATSELSTGASDLWQLRVHPTEPGYSSPFSLISVSSGGATKGEDERIERVDLRVRLGELKAARGTKPLLAPHEDSRSQDMLDAAALIEEFWPSRRRVLVTRPTDVS